MKANNNYMNLRDRITEQFGSQETFAQALGKSALSVNNKLDGKSSFLQRDIVEWSRALEIDLRDAGKYFYDVAVDKMN